MKELSIEEKDIENKNCDDILKATKGGQDK